MIKYSIALLFGGAFLLASCTPKSNTDITASAISDEPSSSCVAGYVEDTPGKGTLDIYFPSEFSPNIQSIKNVSIEVAQEVTEQLGVC